MNLKKLKNKPDKNDIEMNNKECNTWRNLGFSAKPAENIDYIGVKVSLSRNNKIIITRSFENANDLYYNHLTNF